MLIHHLALVDDWERAVASGVYTVSTLGLDLAEVGFIHCCRLEQLAGVVDRYYRDVVDPLVLLTIDTDLLDVPWQLDDVRGQPLTFPHVYGPLAPAAVVTVEPFRPSAGS